MAYSELGKYLFGQIVPHPVPPREQRAVREHADPLDLPLYREAMEGKGWMLCVDIAKATGKTKERVNTYLQEIIHPRDLVLKRKVQGAKQRLVPNEWRWIGEKEGE